MSMRNIKLLSTEYYDVVGVDKDGQKILDYYLGEVSASSARVFADSIIYDNTIDCSKRAVILEVFDDKSITVQDGLKVVVFDGRLHINGKETFEHTGCVRTIAQMTTSSKWDLIAPSDVNILDVLPEPSHHGHYTLDTGVMYADVNGVHTFDVEVAIFTNPDDIHVCHIKDVNNHGTGQEYTDYVPMNIFDGKDYDINTHLVDYYKRDPRLNVSSEDIGDLI
ncbi:MAG: hypothetical protein ACRC92_17315 [Peptostreptococcaceae bacterium]